MDWGLIRLDFLVFTAVVITMLLVYHGFKGAKWGRGFRSKWFLKIPKWKRVVIVAVCCSVGFVLSTAYMTRTLL